MAKFKGLVKSCEVCGAEFRTPQSQAHVRTCSTACGYQIRRVWNKKDKIELKCGNCGGLFTEHPSHAERRKFCSHACRDSDEAVIAARSAAFTGDKNPSWKGGATIKAVSSSGRAYARIAAHLENEKSCRRQRAKNKATPEWADLEQIKLIYFECQRISHETGIQHHVDHAVPLTSNTVSGLHNQFNLQILPGTDNLKKHNRTWPDMW